MESNGHKADKSHGVSTDKASLAGLLLTLGIVFGDIGTSPLYVLKAIVGESNAISRETVLGGLSCIFWTLTLQTTVKYVLLTLQADNKGEGGIFALFTLVRKRAKWLIIPAMLGACTLLADGILTPAISVTSAIEGLKIIEPDIPVVFIVSIILFLLFFFQSYGTQIVGSSFGPVMTLWFAMLAIFGTIQVVGDLGIFRALSPYYAYALLTANPEGFWVLGSVFLCTTGAEALYSDMGHVGRKNIQLSWGFVKACLLINYFGQGAWLLDHLGEELGKRNPFYFMMPTWFIIPGTIIATAAAVVASQALISGSYTLIREAMRLNFWPKVRIVYPTVQKGQLYIPSINWLLFFGCIVIVFIFQESSKMEAAYGLAITVTMISTTLLLYFYIDEKFNRLAAILSMSFFLLIESSFLVANMSKISHGGWFSIVMGALFLFIMWVWARATRLKKLYTEYVALDSYLPIMEAMGEDVTVPQYATNLVYLTGANSPEKIESKIIYSLFYKLPKRADVYWFIHVHLMDEPYTNYHNYRVLVPQKVYWVDFYLGFRVEPRINRLFMEVVEELACNHQIDVISRHPSLRDHNLRADFRFVVNHSVITDEYDFPSVDKFVMDVYTLLRNISLSEVRAYELDTSAVTIETVPMILKHAPGQKVAAVKL